MAFLPDFRAGAAASHLLLVLVLIALFTVCHAPAPGVAIVEPPHWWIGHSVNPVCLLLRGKNLSGAVVTVSGVGAWISRVKTSAPGTSLFCDLGLDPYAAPGMRTIQVAMLQGPAMASFDILPRLQMAGQFAGFGPDDVIYLIMPDRFSDDDPTVSHGEFDRAKPGRYHGGDFQGIIDHLPYLKLLGITALWLTPFYDADQSYVSKQQYVYARQMLGRQLSSSHSTALLSQPNALFLCRRCLGGMERSEVSVSAQLRDAAILKQNAP